MLAPGCCLAAALVAGCASGPLARQTPTPSERLSPQQVVHYLNANNQAVRSLECQRVSITVRQGVQTFSLNGMLAYEKPRNFRLLATAAGSTQADLGSNDQEFWFWLKRADPPALYYCSYEDLPRCHSLRIPLHPDWVAEALCLQEFLPPEHYRSSQKDDALFLLTAATTPQGQPLQKWIVVAMSGPSRGRIRSLHLRANTGRDLWSAHIEEYQNVGAVFIPRKVTIACPEEKLELRLKLDGCRLNGLVAGQYNPTLFQRPRLPGVQDVDLARLEPPPPAAIQRVRGAAP
ncbi:MAG: hypothetical protein C4296_14375 [Gemmataceae bacterium]